MEDEIVTENAKIDSTMLGFDDHEVLTAMLHLSGRSWGQGFGGYLAESTWVFIEEVITLFGVDWERLPGTLLRVKRSGHCSATKIVAIGHIIEDRWIDVAEMEAKMKQKAG